MGLIRKIIKIRKLPLEKQRTEFHNLEERLISNSHLCMSGAVVALFPLAISFLGYVVHPWVVSDHPAISSGVISTALFGATEGLCLYGINYYNRSVEFVRSVFSDHIVPYLRPEQQPQLPVFRQYQQHKKLPPPPPRYQKPAPQQRRDLLPPPAEAPKSSYSQF